MKGPHAGRLTKDGITIHDKEEFEGMRAAGRLAAETLDMIAEHVVPGIATEELDQLCHEFMIKNNSEPATLGYRGYPKSSCISINSVVCHGIPGAPVPKWKKETSSKDDPFRKDDVLRDGDILNIDITCILDGWFGDNSRMYVAGNPKPYAQKLIQVTHDCLMLGIEQVRPGNTFGDIGAAIQRHAEGKGMSVVRDFCGHGLGRVFHAPPNVLHYGKPNSEPVLEPGMFFTVEPMINLGRAETKVLSDDWTAVTRDKSLSAQFEHSVGVTEDGVEIFTLSPAGKFHPTR